MQVSSTVCANHPDRPAMAKCMACDKRICQTCSTEWDGIHYCVTCLQQRRRGGEERAGLAAWLVLLATVAVLYAAVHGVRLLVAQFWGAIS